MTASELQRYHLLKKVLAGEATLAAASTALGISYRQGKRLKTRVVTSGAKGIVHQNRGRPPSNKLPADERQRLLTLCQERYGGVQRHPLRRTAGDPRGDAPVRRPNPGNTSPIRTW